MKSFTCRTNQLSLVMVIIVWVMIKYSTYKSVKSGQNLNHIGIQRIIFIHIQPYIVEMLRVS